jgi:pantoate--beta-alanine ligase
MEIISDPKLFQDQALAERARGRVTALVPTMGFLHEGHASLIRWAAANADTVYVSVFVNPTQFGPGEDLEAYPRDPERDVALAEACGARAVFMPEPGAIYAPDHCTWVEVPPLARHLCGASRPVHFRGVATVVSILLHLALPHVAVFGRKDWQQLAVLKRMARDLHLPCRIEGRPIVREADGLALSSRNVYLGPAERAQAPELHAGLLHAAALARAGQRDAAALKAAIAAHYAEHVPAGEVDYIEIVDPENVQPVATLEGPALAAVAVRLGRARLIDNELLHP